MTDPVAVASSVYNLSGDFSKRPNFLKSQVMGHIAQEGPLSIGQAIVGGYSYSSTSRIHRFLKWSQHDLGFQEHIGTTNGILPRNQNLDMALIEAHITVEVDYDIYFVLTANISTATVSYWVAQYIDKYYPGQDYTYAYSPSTNTVTVTLTVDSSVVTFSPADFVEGALYLYVHYAADTPSEEGHRLFWSIYRQGTGIPELDPLFDLIDPELLGAFYPPIPFRFDNQPVSADSPNPDLAAIYPICKKATKRAFGINFDNLQEKILDTDQNPSIGDIDYIYAVLAVSLNTQENAGRKYIYNFLEYLMANSYNYSATDKLNWLTQWDSISPRPTPPWKHLQVESVRTGISNYRTDITWAFLNETTGPGLLVPGAKKGELWFEVLPAPLPAYTRDDGFNQEVALCWQVTKNFWRRIVVTGLQYNNYVYVTNNTRVTAQTALELLDRDSEFLVPLHESLYRDMSLTDSLQMGTSCSYLVFNCLEVHKLEWYESEWFKLIVVVTIIVVSIVAAVATGGASLGTSGETISSILASAGLSSVATLIISASVDVLTGLLVSTLISEMAVTLFGEKWGHLIGAIVTFIFSFGMNVSSISDAINALSRPETWIALATATGNGVSGYIQGQAAQVAEDTAKMLQEIGEQTAEVQRKYNELMGGSNNGIDLGVVSQYRSDLTEKPSDFLTRTLVTGSDIVEVTLKQIEDFTRNNLKLEMA